MKSEKKGFMAAFKKKYKNEIVAYSLLAYPLLHWGVFFVIQFFRAFGLSFTDWDIFSEANFVGFSNYTTILFKDEVFRIALINTVLWALAMAVGPLVIGFLVALMVNHISKGSVFFRTLLYWPALISKVVFTSIQERIFSSSPYGLINRLLGLFGVDAVAWFDNPDIALPSLMLWPFLMGFSFPMLFFLAGLKQIPKTFYEAAEVDGAKKSTILFKITLPLMKPIIFLNLILGMTGTFSLTEGFRALAPMQLITKGGPIHATYSVVYKIYTDGFDKYQMGYASAMSFILFAIILIMTIIQFKIQGEQVSYE
ncbi:MAG: sugar ABC transporter permease [Firmicutes bacterium]|nr:sugar ABC transporter permease [Bacillota bacterium]